MGLERRLDGAGLSRRRLLGALTLGAAALAAGNVLPSGLWVPSAHAETDAKPPLQEDLEKMLSDEPGKGEQARQRIYEEINGAPPFDAAKAATGRIITGIKSIVKRENLPVDTVLYFEIEQRLRETRKEMENPMLSPGQAAIGELRQAAFTAYDQARQAIRLRQLGITPSAELSAEFVFVPKGYYTIGVDQKVVEGILAYLKRVVPAQFFNGAVDSFRDVYWLRMAPNQDFILGDFFISRTPVTHAQLRIFLRSEEGKGGRVLEKGVRPVYIRNLPDAFFWKNQDFQPGTEAYPALGTTFRTLESYVVWRGKMLTGTAGRLPDTLEWEAAGRGSGNPLFSHGDINVNHWGKGRPVNKLLDSEWEPNYDLSRPTSFVSSLGVRWMGTIGENVYAVKRDKYGIRTTERTGEYDLRGCGRGTYQGWPGMREFVSAYHQNGKLDPNLFTQVGFRVLIPAENLKKN